MDLKSYFQMDFESKTPFQFFFDVLMFKGYIFGCPQLPFGLMLLSNQTSSQDVQTVVKGYDLVIIALFFICPSLLHCIHSMFISSSDCVQK